MAAQEDHKVADPAVAELIVRLTGELQDHYPLGDIGEQYRRAITKAWRSGAYRGLSPCALASRLTDDAQAVHRDRHLRVWCAEEEVPPPDRIAAIGHGFRSVSLDPDLSIALITAPGPWELDDETFEAAGHAMGFAAEAKTVVIDLRDNPGGHGEIGYFLASYFFPTGEARPFERGLYRPPHKPETVTTLPYVPGRKMPDADLFILVNAGTGSAAEGFAFGMQQLGRAAIIGQTTAGAGIAGHDTDLGHGLKMFVPNKLVVAADSDLTYEGKGVVPDVKTVPGKEYEAAMSAIRQRDEEAVKRAGPSVAKAVEPASAPDLSPLPDPAPNLESCQHKQFGEKERTLAMTNRCRRATTVQYMNGDHADVTFEAHLESGDRMDLHLPASQWWIITVCPEGYFSTLPVAAANRQALAKGGYACARSKASSEPR